MPGACALFLALGVIVPCIFKDLEWFTRNRPACVTACVQSLLVDVRDARAGI